MHPRYITAVLIAAAAVHACGPQSRRPESSATQTRAVDRSQTPLASSLRVAVDDGVDLALHLTNTSGKRLELAFPSGLTHDFAVLDADGHEVWRWSAGRRFTQALQTRLIDPGETVTYRERWSGPVANGSFAAVAVLNSTSHPLRTQVDFSLP